jgi:hypothetical protein
MTTLQDRLRDCGENFVGARMCKEAADELDRLQAENEALRKDALRYARSADPKKLPHGKGQSVLYALDEAIDAAMKPKA